MRCLDALVLGGGEGGTRFEFDVPHVVAFVDCEVIAAHCVRLEVGDFAGVAKKARDGKRRKKVVSLR